MYSISDIVVIDWKDGKDVVAICVQSQDLWV